MAKASVKASSAKAENTVSASKQKKLADASMADAQMAVVAAVEGIAKIVHGRNGAQPKGKIRSHK